MGVVSRMWVESMGVVSGCGRKEVYRFPHITYPYSFCMFYFLFIFKNFVLVPVLFYN